jgi:hypothetical protein
MISYRRKHQRRARRRSESAQHDALLVTFTLAASSEDEIDQVVEDVDGVPTKHCPFCRAHGSPPEHGPHITNLKVLYPWDA